MQQSFEEGLGGFESCLCIPGGEIGYEAKSLEISARDRAGNESSRQLSIEKEDYTSPRIEISGIKNGAIYAGEIAPQIKISDEQAGNLEIIMEAEIEGAGKREKITYGKSDNVSFSKDGDYIFRVTAADPSGNSAQREIYFTIDKEAPVIKGLEGLSGGSFDSFCLKRDAKTVIEDMSIANYRLYLNGRDYSEEETVAESGEYVLRVSAADQAGNTSDSEVAFVIREGEDKEKTEATEVLKEEAEIPVLYSQQEVSVSQNETGESEGENHLIFLCFLIPVLIGAAFFVRRIKR